jgi:hypothetical protein
LRQTLRSTPAGIHALARDDSHVTKSRKLNYEGDNMVKDWTPYGDIVTPEKPCGRCSQESAIHLGYSPTKGFRFAGFQIAGWANEDIAVCGSCGQAEHMGSQGLAEARDSGSWEITGVMGVGFIDPQTGRLGRRPLS